MTIIKEEFIEGYITESKEHLNNLSEIIIELRKAPENSELLSEFLRVLHSIKGTSRMMNFSNVESIANGLEDIFKGISEKRFTITKSLIQLVLKSVIYIEEALKQIVNFGDDKIITKILSSLFKKAIEGVPFSIDQLDEEMGINTGKNRITTNKNKYFNPIGEQNTIRVKVSKVDDIVKQLNTLIIQQFQFKKQNEKISDLENKLRENLGRVQLHTEKNKEYSELESGLSESLKMINHLKKSYSQEIIQLEQLGFKLQEEVLGLRTLPLKLVLEPLKKMVEDTSLSVGKEIDFEMSGTDLLLDKAILEQINDPILHLVRNCIDHGIEPVNERIDSGKNNTGKISIICSSEGGRINLQIKDDGRGLNFDKIREKALELYPDQQKVISEMDKNSLTSYLFNSGFTTKDDISSLSGRGVGLDIVKYNIETIKGKITVKSEENIGTTVILSLPLSLATVDGFFVLSEEEKFLIPAAFVKEVLIIRPDDVISIMNKNVIRLRDMIIPVYPLSSVLDKNINATPEKYSVLIVESLGDIIGIIVDSVLQFSSMIYKPLPANMIKLKVFQGVVFDENFDIINILYVPELINRFKGIRNIEFKKKFSSKNKEYKKILVVDDSLSTREIEKSILELENYNVEEAVDGIDALEKLKSQYFHLIITDIQMPRMDGLTLIENVRKQEKYNETPIIVITTEADEKKRNEIYKMGCNGIINKRDFDRGNLLFKVKELIG